QPKVPDEPDQPGKSGIRGFPQFALTESFTLGSAGCVTRLSEGRSSAWPPGGAQQAVIGRFAISIVVELGESRSNPVGQKARFPSRCRTVRIRHELLILNWCSAPNSPNANSGSLLGFLNNDGVCCERRTK